MGINNDVAPQTRAALREVTSFIGHVLLLLRLALALALTWWVGAFLFQTIAGNTSLMALAWALLRDFVAAFLGVLHF